MVIRGGPSDNSLLGSDGDDLLIDPTGNDWIDGAFGNDSISSGEGNDRVFGDEGNDHVFGEEGNDYLYGDSGRDRPPVAGQDNDKLYGGPGDDVLFASDGRESADRRRRPRHLCVPIPQPGPRPSGPAGPGLHGHFGFRPDAGYFDAVGYYSDGTSANFVNHASSPGGYLPQRCGLGCERRGRQGCHRQEFLLGRWRRECDRRRDHRRHHCLPRRPDQKRSSGLCHLRKPCR